MSRSFGTQGSLRAEKKLAFLVKTLRRLRYYKNMTENEISKIVVEEAIYIHKSIGPGMLESSYVHCLAYRLIKRGLNVKTQVPVPLIFEEVKLECGYRADLVIDNKVVIEAKSIEAIASIHLAQTLTYLRFLTR